MQSFFGQSRRDVLSWVDRPARAARVFQSIYRDRETRFESLVSIPKTYRDSLSQALSLELPTITSRFDSEDGTRRYLLGLHDGESIESVMIPASGRDTYCVSSQVGCALACAFCLTGQLGLTRDLSAGEIVSQVLILQRETSSRRFSVVLMGMGEPLQNYDNVLQALGILHDDHGLAVPLSRITISTAGLIPAIDRLAEERHFPNLCVSLTGVTNALRDTLMPINRKYPVEAVMNSIRRLSPQRQRRVMIECVMIKGVTDTLAEARELSRLIGDLPVKVNLIPLNPAPEIPFERSDDETVLQFQKVLLDNGTAAFVRKSRGSDVFGACGQLKRKVLA